MSTTYTPEQIAASLSDTQLLIGDCNDVYTDVENPVDYRDAVRMLGRSARQMRELSEIVEQLRAERDKALRSRDVHKLQLDIVAANGWGSERIVAERMLQKIIGDLRHVYTCIGMIPQLIAPALAPKSDYQRGIERATFEALKILRESIPVANLPSLVSTLDKETPQ